MKILVTGATGFIAAQIVSTLSSAGHELYCCVRNIKAAKQRFWFATIIPCDFNKDTTPETWLKRLSSHNIEVVINCVGILQGSRKQSIDAIHHDTPTALFTACQQLNINRVIQLSALGAGDVGTQ